MRDGYQKNFLGNDFVIELPQPILALEADILQPPGLADGDVVIPYIHYSILMSRSTRQALYSVANVDLGKQKTVSGKQGRKWFVDKRVGQENQIPNYAYTYTQWDRGHLTRRTAVTWGDSFSVALNASNDSCAYTNACMQHKFFNEDEWRVVEKLVSKFDLASKLTVMTGPVFTTTDRFFIKNFGDYPVRIPSAFWKIVTYVDKNNKLATDAYIFFQDLVSIKSDDGEERIDLGNLQVTTTELTKWTGLIFDQKLYDSNQLKFYDGPERISTKEHKALLDKDPSMVHLDEGIVNEDSITSARDSLPIEEFYDLIDQISWV